MFTSKAFATSNQAQLEKASFAAGCFWHVEEAFRQTHGVISTTAGYAGGATKDPTYQDVCSGKTGHAETVEITFNPKEVTYEELLSLFWTLHNPSSPQTNKPLYQYRSVIFYYSDSQKEKAQKAILEQEKKLGSKILTELRPAPAFYRAEEYHQQYYEKANHSFCPKPGEN